MDGGSTVNLINPSVADELDVPRREIFKIVKAADDSVLYTIRQEIDLEINNTNENMPQYTLFNVGISPVPLIIPSQKLRTNLSKKTRSELADPNFEIPHSVDLLISGGDWQQLKNDDSTKIGSLRLQESLFGKVVQGFAPTNVSTSVSLSTVETVMTPEDINEIKQQFAKVFELETEAHDKDNYAEVLFKKQHKRDSDGRFIVPILWALDKELGESRKICLLRNKKVLNNLTKDEQARFVDIIREYSEKGIIRRCDDLYAGSYYAPLVIVKKKEHLTTSLRICLDGSQKTSNGRSLNDIQLVGRKLTPDINQRLLRFRKGKYAITADVKQMYLSIRITEEDRKYQRTIICLDGYKNQEIEYNSLVFGARTSANLAIESMNQLAHDGMKRFPLGATMLRDCCYVDDISASANTLREAQQAALQLVQLCATAKLELHKMTSNNLEVLKFLDKANKLSSIDSTDISSVLGIHWDTHLDCIAPKFKLENIEKLKLTKRAALSILARFYDSLGLLSPFFVTPRLLIQKIWIQDRAMTPVDFAKSWDLMVETTTADEFKAWYANLKGINDFKFPRYSGFEQGANQSLYVYSDASEKAIGAVVFLRTVPKKGCAIFNILISKGRTAPITPINQSEKIAALTIPRLELAGAQLATELVVIVKEAWQLPENFPTTIFTDSEIVLALVSGYKIRDAYNENRLRPMRKAIKRECWAHVPTDSNVADIISRGCTQPHELPEMWMKGPTLHRDRNFIPTNKFKVDEPADWTEEEIKNDEKTSEADDWTTHDYTETILASLIAGDVISKEIAKKPNEFIESLTQESIDANHEVVVKLSSFRKTTRVIAWLLRSVKKFKSVKKAEIAQLKPGLQSDTYQFLTGKEISDARNFAIRIEQKKFLSPEIDALKSGKFVNKGKYKKENLFIDSEGLLRSGTRIQGKHFDYNVRNPIVLPQMSSSSSEPSIALQLIRDQHLKSLHSGLPTLRFDIGQKFLIRNLSRGIKRFISRCIECLRHRAQVKTQIMADIPENITLRTPVFTNCALDYMGPISLKTKARRTRASEDDTPKITYDKAWVLLVTCIVSGAISLELVTDLTVEAFLRAFMNHCNVRGTPASIYSDNFATFKRARDMLQEVYDILAKSLNEGDQAIKSRAAEMGIKWRYTVPYSSHWNARSERQIGSVRVKMSKSIGAHKLSFPDMHHLLKCIENIINSRPLMIARTSAAEGQFILTPTHFLMGREVSQLPTYSFPSKRVTVREALEIKDLILDDFWKRFRPAHLETLKMRQKWTKKTEEIREDDLVLVVDPNLPPGKWQKGIVVKTLIGVDGHVRACRIKISRLDVKGFGCKFVERPISKLVLLREEIDLSYQPASSDEPETTMDVDIQSYENEANNSEQQQSEKVSVKFDEENSSSIKRETTVTPLNENDDLKSPREEPEKLKAVSVTPETSEAHAPKRNLSKIELPTKNTHEPINVPTTLISDVSSVSGESGEAVKTRRRVKIPMEPTRRSARLLGRAALVATMLICIAWMPNSSADVVTKINDTTEAGVMVYHHSSVLIKRGIYHAVIQTQRTVLNDSHSILEWGNEMAEGCRNILHSNNCNMLNINADYIVKETINEIESATGRDLQDIVAFYATDYRDEKARADWRKMHDNETAQKTKEASNHQKSPFHALNQNRYQPAYKAHSRIRKRAAYMDFIEYMPEMPMMGWWVPKIEEDYHSWADIRQDWRNKIDQTFGRAKRSIEKTFDTLTNPTATYSGVSDFIEEYRDEVKTQGHGKTVLKRMGAVWSAFMWLFNTDATQYGSSLAGQKTTAAFAHSLLSVEDMMKARQRSEQLIGNEVARMKSIIREEMSFMDQQRVDAAMFRALAMGKFHAEQTLALYKGHPMSDAELTGLINEINLRVAADDAVVPNIPLEQLRKVITHEITADGEILIHYGIPLVSRNIMERVTIVPVPSVSADTIGNFSITQTIIDMRSQLYWEMAGQQPEIMGNFEVFDLPYLMVANEHAPCQFKAIILKGNGCGMIPLPQNFSMWFQTPAHNVYQFFEKGKKELICPDSRQTIDSVSGVIELPDKCVIKTPTRIITASLDLASSSSKMAFMPHDWSMLNKLKNAQPIVEFEATKSLDAETPETEAPQAMITEMLNFTAIDEAVELLEEESFESDHPLFYYRRYIMGFGAFILIAIGVIMKVKYPKGKVVTANAVRYLRDEQIEMGIQQNIHSPHTSPPLPKRLFE